MAGPGVRRRVLEVALDGGELGEDDGDGAGVSGHDPMLPESTPRPQPPDRPSARRHGAARIGAPDDEAPVPPLTTWTHLDDLHRWYAELDAPDPRPHLVGFAGERPAVLVGLRPFPPGGHRGPLVEALALALPLGADRVSLGLPGRAWSLDDPVPPVTEGADLRQRVLTQVAVDGHGTGPPTVRTRLHPFRAVGDGGLVWDAAVDPGPASGWVTDALVTLLDRRTEAVLGLTDDQVGAQLTRLLHLGHEVLLPEDAPTGARP